MVIDKLEFLLALAREGHFGRAAEACGVTQPTLSAGVKQLEDSFGVLLVNRGSRFQNFTPEGERVLEWARRIVGDTRAMREEIHALKHGLSGRLRIAAIQTTLAMIETLTTLYRERHPEVQFTVLSAHCRGDFPASGKSRDRRRRLLSRQGAGRANHRHPALSRAILPADRGRRAARQPQQGDMGGGRADPAVPDDTRHADCAASSTACCATPAAIRDRVSNRIR